MYINKGSTMNLTCIIKHSPEPPPVIYWTHNFEVRIVNKIRTDRSRLIRMVVLFQFLSDIKKGSSEFETYVCNIFVQFV